MLENALKQESLGTNPCSRQEQRCFSLFQTKSYTSERKHDSAWSAASGYQKYNHTALSES